MYSRGVSGNPCRARLHHCGFLRYLNSTSLSRDSDSLLSTVVYLLRKLRWKKIIFLYEEPSYGVLQTLLDRDDLSVFFHRLPSNLQLTSDVSDLLKDIHYKSFPDLHFVVISTYTRAYQFLQMVEQHDLNSKRTTDYRHYSFWVVVCSGPCHPQTGILPTIHELENVVLVTPPGEPSDGSGIPVFTLTSVPGGREFTLIPDLRFQRGEEIREMVFPNIKYGFNNRTLTVSVMKSAGLMNTDNGYSGYLKEILDAMARKLNFSYTIDLPPDRRWGVKINNTWDGLIGQLVRREVDLVVSTVTIHQEREEEMDFLLPPTFTEVYDIIYRLHGNREENWLVYFRPFQAPVLLTLFASLVFFTGLTATFAYYEDVILTTRKASQKQLLFLAAESFYNLFAFLIGKGFSVNYSTWALGFLIFTWGLFSIIVGATFCANLVAFYADSKEQVPFRSLAELVEQEEYKFGMESGDIREVIFRNAKSGDRKKAWDKIVRMNQSDPDVLHRDIKVHTAKMLTEKYAYFTSRRFGAEHVSMNCRVRLVGDGIMWQQYGIGVPQDYPAKSDLERLLSMMADSGLFHVWYERWKVVHENKCVVDSSVKVLTLVDMQTAFYALFGGMGLAGGTLLVEFVIHFLQNSGSKDQRSTNDLSPQ